MPLLVADLLELFKNTNVRAFGRCVRHSESHNRDDTAYRTMFGGRLAPDLSRHPRKPIMSKWGWTSAAGAYQAMCATPGGEVKTDTWGDFCRAIGSTADDTPFDKDHQDAFFVWCLMRRKALDAVLAGRLREAIDACSWEWASWPPGRYGQPTVTFGALANVYKDYGGVLDHAATPAKPAPKAEPTPSVPATPAIEQAAPVTQPVETSMPAPLLLSAVAAFGPLIGDLIPAVAKLFDRKSETPAKTEAATKVIDVLVKATESVNVQQAVERMQADPAVLEAARKAVVTEPTIMGLLEVGGGIERAREQVHEMATLPPQRNVALLVTGALAPLIYIVVCAVVFLDGWSDEMRSVVVTAIVTGLLGSITGFFLGSSFGSQRKTDMINDRVPNG